MNTTPTTPKFNSFLYYILYPAHIIALLGVFVFPFYFSFGVQHLVMLVVGWIMFAGFGSAIVLHRISSHRSLELRRGLKIPSVWIASLCLQGSALGWAAVHRGSHHRYSDTDKDAHSPTKGTLYAYHTWLYDWSNYFSPKYVVDLLRDPVYMFFATHYTRVIIATYIIVGLINWQILLFTFIIPAVYSLHQESLVNVLCHKLNWGYRNFQTSDNSSNIPLLALVGWGQAWHNNHHHRPGVYDFGTTVSKKRMEFDPCLLLVPLIATKKSRQKIYEARKNAMAHGNT